ELTKATLVVYLLWRSGGHERASLCVQVCAAVVSSCVQSSRVSPSMQRLVLPVIITAFTIATAAAGPLNLNPPGGAQSGAGSPADGALVHRVQSPGPNFGGGFLELLFRGPGNSDAAPR